MIADSMAMRYSWNEYNRVMRKLMILATAEVHSYTSATWRPFDNDTSLRVEAVIGRQNSFLELFTICCAKNNGGISPQRCLGIGEDKTNATDSDVYVATANWQVEPSISRMSKMPSVGYHFYQMVQC